MRIEIGKGCASLVETERRAALDKKHLGVEMRNLDQIM